MTTVAVLGSTGSIGTQTLEVVAAEADRFEIVALGAGSSVEALAAQARVVRPRMVALADAGRAAELKELLPPGVALEAGPDALAAAALEADVVVNGVVGFAGLPVTLATLGAGKRLALANKESLIAAGPVVRAVRDTPGAELVPVDSEHCAVHQCLRASDGTRRLAGWCSPPPAVRSGAAPRPTWTRSRSRRRSPTRRGAWGPRSPWTRPPS